MLLYINKIKYIVVTIARLGANGIRSQLSDCPLRHPHIHLCVGEDGEREKERKFQSCRDQYCEDQSPSSICRVRSGRWQS